MWEYHSLAMKPPWSLLNLHIPCFFCTMPLGLAFKIGCQQDVFWIWWSYPPATILLDLVMQLAGRVAISSKITSNHQGIDGNISCMCQNNTQLTMKSWSCHKHRHLCKPGPSKILQYIFAIIAFNEYPWNISEIIVWDLWHRMVSAFPAA